MDEKLKRLRRTGTILKPKFIIGKNGLTEQVIRNIRDTLKKEQLIKIKILGNVMEDKDKKAFVNDIIQKTDSKLVQFIGFTVVLSRK